MSENVKINENAWMKIIENEYKMSENEWKWVKMSENEWKWVNMSENEWKLMKINEH